MAVIWCIMHDGEVSHASAGEAFVPAPGGRSAAPLPAIAIVEDDPVFAKAVRAVLREAEPDREIVLFSTLADFRARCRKGFALLLLDLGLPDGTGLEAIPEIRQAMPETTICVITSIRDEQTVFQAIQLGALGYVWKTDIRNIGDTARQLLEGGAVLSQTIALLLLQHFQTPPSQRPLDALTHREKQIVDLVVEGKAVRDIAGFFGTAEGTVRNQIKSIYRKLEVNSRSRLILKFKR